MKDWLACDVCHGSGVEEVYGGHGNVLEHECTKTPMTIEGAVASILGPRAADAIIKEQGIRWAVVGAMAAAGPGTKNDPRAIITIRQWNADHGGDDMEATASASEPPATHRTSPQAAKRATDAPQEIGERTVFREEGAPGQSLTLRASGEVTDDMLEALEDYVKRQRKRLSRGEN